MRIDNHDVRPAIGQPFVLRAFNFLPHRLYQRLRRAPVLGWLGRRALDASLHRPGLQVTPIIAGPLAGMSMALDPRIHKEMVVGHYEPAMVERLRRYLGPGDLAFDVGAHLGYVTLLMAGLTGVGGRVVAFEPDPAVANLLAANLRRNAGRVTATMITEPVAVGAAVGTAGFQRGADNSTGRLSGDAGDLVVPVTTLDEATARFGIPRLIKVDVEGGELEVLRGAAKLLSLGRTTFLLELHSPELEEACTALLKERGWVCTTLREPGTSIHVVATPATGAIR